MRWIVAVLLLALAGCSTPMHQTPAASTKTSAPERVSCPSPVADYLLGTIFVHVTYLDDPGGEPSNSANVTVGLQRGGNATTPGEPMAQKRTDSRGCVDFLLQQNGTYRFETPGPCAPRAVLFHWDGTFLDQVELPVTFCE